MSDAPPEDHGQNDPTIFSSIYQQEIDEMGILVPFMDKEEVTLLVEEIGRQVHPLRLDLREPRAIVFDLEQLQVYDWDTFSKRSGAEAALTAWFRVSYFEPIASIYYACLRSMIGITWGEISSADDIREISEREAILCDLLSAAARRSASKPGDALLVPYWARLAYFNTIRNLPKNSLNDRITSSTTVIPALNQEVGATTWRSHEWNILTLDLALEPVLKLLNSFFDFIFRHIKRTAWGKSFAMIRAMLEQVERGEPLHQISLPMPYTNRENITAIKARTDLQIQFVIAHELAHVYLDHGSRGNKETSLNAVGDEDPSDSVSADVELLWEEEFAADSFALTLFGDSSIVAAYRITTKDSRDWDQVQHALRMSWIARDQIQIYLHYMRLVEAVRRSIRPGRPAPRSHPSAEERIFRLRKASPGGFDPNDLASDTAFAVDQMIEYLQRHPE